MVGVVETRELRDKDPDRQEGEQPDRPLGGQDNREPEADRAAVGEGEQPSTPDVAPPARLTGRLAQGADQGPSNVLHVEEPPPGVSGPVPGWG